MNNHGELVKLITETYADIHEGLKKEKDSFKEINNIKVNKLFAIEI